MSKVIQFKVIAQNWAVPSQTEKGYLLSVEAHFYGQKFQSVYTYQSYYELPDNSIMRHKKWIYKEIRKVIEKDLIRIKELNLGVRPFTAWLKFSKTD